MERVDLDALTFDDRGLIPVIVQDADNGEVLMFAWSNRDALERTIAEGRMVYWSRSRQERGARATPPDTSSTGRSSGPTATATCSSRGSTRRAPPATRASGRASSASSADERSRGHLLCDAVRPAAAVRDDRARHADDLAVRVRLREQLERRRRPRGPRRSGRSRRRSRGSGSCTGSRPGRRPRRSAHEFTGPSSTSKERPLASLAANSVSRSSSNRAAFGSSSPAAIASITAPGRDVLREPVDVPVGVAIFDEPVREPDHHVDAEVRAQALLDLLSGHRRVPVRMKEALLRGQQRALTVDEERAAFEDERRPVPSDRRSARRAAPGAARRRRTAGTSPPTS